MLPTQQITEISDRQLSPARNVGSRSPTEMKEWVFLSTRMDLHTTGRLDFSVFLMMFSNISIKIVVWSTETKELASQIDLDARTG